jgi:hypothetical protein
MTPGRWMIYQSGAECHGEADCEALFSGENPKLLSLICGNLAFDSKNIIDRSRFRRVTPSSVLLRSE